MYDGVGGMGHTLPFLIPDAHFNLAIAVAVAVVIVELLVIAWIRNRYMDTPMWQAALQVIVGRGPGFRGGHPDRQQLTP